MLELHPRFSNHMVIQRDAPIPVSGRAAAGAPVSIRVGGVVMTTQANAVAAWLIELPPMPAGGPWQVEVRSGSEVVTVTDVWIGDVWLCAGQSNMDWKLRQCQATEILKARAAAHPSVRVLTVPKAGSDSPVEGLDAKWTVSTPETVDGFSAVATFFSQHLRALSSAAAGIPIGLVDASYGGTEIEAWMSPEFLSREFAGEGLQPSRFDFNPSAMFNAMIAPLLPMRARGALWYQGESNANRPGQYARLLEGLVRDWRHIFASPELPFLIVQLPNYAFPLERLTFTWVREDEAAVARKVPGVHLAVTIDGPDGHDLHPHEKEEIGRRLALLAARHCYGEGDVVASGPVYTGHEIDGDTARIHFDSAAGLKTTDGGPVAGFALEAEGGIYLYALGAIDGNTVVLDTRKAAGARCIRYAWEGDPRVNLVNGAGLPAAPFRTDNNPVSPVEIATLPPAHQVEIGDMLVTVDGDGSLRSLLLGATEFLRFGPPLARGGVYYYLFELFGAMPLFHTVKEGPRVISAENFSASARYVFENTGVRCTLFNKGSEHIFYRIALLNDVEGVELDKPGSVVVQREGRRLRFEGVDQLRRHDALGAVVEVEVLPAQSRAVFIRQA